MKTRIRARYIIGYDAAAGDHVVYTDAELVYSDDTVVHVGYDYPGPVDRELSFPRSIVSPGFIDLNATADLEASDLFLDTKGDSDLALGTNWSEAYFTTGRHDLSDPDEEMRKYHYALCKLVSCGTTTILPVTGLLFRKWAEGRDEFEQLAAVASRLGVRTWLGPSYRDGVNVTTNAGVKETWWQADEGRRGLVENVAFIQGLGSDPLIRGVLVPSTIETCSADLLAATREWAERLAVPVRLHATQSWWEFQAIRERFGKTPIGHLHSLGLLNRQLLLPHAIYVNGYSGADCGAGDDLDVLAASGATVLHCPNVIARGGTVMESFGRYRSRGIRVAIATDCNPPDMLENMYLALLMGRTADRDAAAVTTRDVFRAATLVGADALGRDDLGRLCPGARADITVVDLGAFRINAVDDPLRAMVLSARRSDVTDVIINGRDVVRDGIIPGVEYDELRDWAEGYFRRLKMSYSERDYRQRPPETFFSAVFPVRHRT
ncbi:MAG: amidohydrolase family protein [Planctomycetes bacterium]|nr:amidohydrolase family protein [Planctomycetota bacterium]